MYEEGDFRLARGSVFSAVWKGIGVMQDRRSRWREELDIAAELVELGARFEKTWRVIVFERLEEADITIAEVEHDEVICE